jgi:hypothetical protein
VNKARGKTRVVASRAVGNENQEAKGVKDVAKGEAINKKTHVKGLGSQGRLARRRSLRLAARPPSPG